MPQSIKHTAQAVSTPITLHSATLRLVKVESGIKGLLPTSWAPPIYSVSLLTKLRCALAGNGLLHLAAVRSFLARICRMQKPTKMMKNSEKTHQGLYNVGFIGDENNGPSGPYKVRMAVEGWRRSSRSLKPAGGLPSRLATILSTGSPAGLGRLPDHSRGRTHAPCLGDRQNLPMIFCSLGGWGGWLAKRIRRMRIFNISTWNPLSRLAKKPCNQGDSMQRGIPVLPFSLAGFFSSPVISSLQAAKFGPSCRNLRIKNRRKAKRLVPL